MEANTETSEFESLMFQRGVCAQDRKKPHISHAQGCPGTYTPQHIPITDCSTPQQTSLKGFNHTDHLFLEVIQPTAFCLGGRVV